MGCLFVICFWGHEMNDTNPNFMHDLQGEITSNYRTIAVFDPPRMGNLMTSVICFDMFFAFSFEQKLNFLSTPNSL